MRGGGGEGAEAGMDGHACGNGGRRVVFNESCGGYLSDIGFISVRIHNF